VHAAVKFHLDVQAQAFKRSGMTSSDGCTWVLWAGFVFRFSPFRFRYFLFPHKKKASSNSNQQPTLPSRA
jgi:hypothetical protein